MNGATKWKNKFETKGTLLLPLQKKCYVKLWF